MTKEIEEVFLRTKGILPVQKLRKLAKAGIIRSDSNYPLQDNQFQPNSIDLRLGAKAYRVRCSFLPEDETVQSKVDKLKQYEFSIEDGAVLEPNCVYIIPLLEQLHLPGHVPPQKTLFDGEEVSDPIKIVSDEHLTAKANPKSTTGRLDIFTRVITDHSHRFEEIRSGYSGNLYLEVVPKSFPIQVRTGQRLNQLRIRHGYTLLSDQDILRTHHSDPLLFDEQGDAIPMDEIKVSNGLFMSVNLHGDEGQIVGYKAKKHRDLINLENVNHYSVEDFWEPIYYQKDDHLILEPEAFYIFASKERCRIPTHLAAEMIAYDTGSGELRTHYAGFFDSGFGGSAEAGGARAVLEVRSHDVPFLIEDGQTFCSMKFEPNTEIPEFVYGTEIKSNYQGQGLKLGKHFKQEDE
ncbi:2'-deoxycytidine 5'-triphosphate deaminase [Aliifodinibius sp. S!AR15-10]|uniref:2'-deoxycytidine 5'-triphosphate deaminase n=1 Tax=Aliifodinibius sp. S!AR15-10 TaxID=2950437 RepID=UPI002866480C|nr:2'-deoxycytidine 5'-triphosphate deaminase [Aliifodinibius sp. S!AR15-10]MDR8390843.1 2'-deoxycytidine 5'-triphosphate deaminase [Aliifodinibius sp. S!AR15-10]